MRDDGEDNKISLIMALRGAGISDDRVMRAMEAVPRDLFVPDTMQREAWADTALPINCGQTISQPTVVAVMTQALDVGPRHKVLEIGTGSGYQAAILSHLCRRVYTIERHRRLFLEANEVFKKLHLTNVVTLLGDGFKGWPEQAPFDRIIVTAAAEHVPEALLDQLKVGGVMILPIGPQGKQVLLKIVRTEDGFDSEELLPVRFVPMLAGIPREQG